MNKARLVRTHGTDSETMGYMELNGKFFGYTLEDPIREEKVWGATCIPFGKYTMRNTHSNRFKKQLPLIYNVPNQLVVLADNGDSWAGIRVHGGNHHLHTEGCPLIAKNQHINSPRDFTYRGKKVRVNNWIQGSLENEFAAAIGKGTWELEIVHADEVVKKQTLIRLRNPLMKSNAIIKLQQQLNTLGYNAGKADGIYGPKSEEAVIRFQTEHKLGIDGIVGNQTWLALDRAIRNK